MRDVRECQCPIEIPRGVNPWPAAGVMFDLAGHQDWRIREWVAYRNIYCWESAGDPSESSLLRRSWHDLRRTLRADGHETVAETAKQMGLETPPDGRRLLRNRHDRLHLMLHTDHEVVRRAREAYRNGVLAHRPVVERILGVDGHGVGSLAPELFEDPVCAVREAATTCLDPVTATTVLLSHLDVDPCGEVGAARDLQFGPPGRLLSPQEWASRNGAQPDPTLDPGSDDPALLARHLASPPPQRVGLHPCGRRPVRRSRPPDLLPGACDSSGREPLAELGETGNGHGCVRAAPSMRLREGARDVAVLLQLRRMAPGVQPAVPSLLAEPTQLAHDRGGRGRLGRPSLVPPRRVSRLVRPAARGPDHAASGAARGSADRRQRTAGPPRTPALSVRESARSGFRRRRTGSSSETRCSGAGRWGRTRRLRRPSSRLTGRAHSCVRVVCQGGASTQVREGIPVADVGVGCPVGCGPRPRGPSATDLELWAAPARSRCWWARRQPRHSHPRRPPPARTGNRARLRRRGCSRSLNQTHPRSRRRVAGL